MRGKAHEGFVFLPSRALHYSGQAFVVILIPPPLPKHQSYSVNQPGYHSQ